MVKPEKKKIPTVLKPKHKNKGNKLVQKLENAAEQEAPSKIRRMLNFRERMSKTPDLKSKPNHKKKGLQSITSITSTTNLDDLERKSAHLAAVAAKKKTKKYLKKQEFLNRKEQTKQEIDLGMITEQKLLSKGTVKFQDFVMEPPKITAIPKDRSKKKLVAEVLKDSLEDKEKLVKSHKEINISSLTGERLGRTRKLKTLPEAERNALLIQRQKAIELYRLKHKK